MGSPSFSQLVARYRNTAEGNDALHRELTDATWGDPLLSQHRRHVEEHKLGFGDPAFHAMWAQLLAAAAERFHTVRALEIGVFKGQIISLWTMLARQRGWDIRVSGLGPLAGQTSFVSRFKLLRSLLYRWSRRYREQVDNANFYPDENYENIIRGLFAHFELDFDGVRFHRGFSTDPAILQHLAQESYHIIYVDGDHTYEGALHDFRTFAPKVVPGGWLVADDAGNDLPGTSFWKGHDAVTRAVQIMPSLGFKNVLNVGHNRVFERIAS